MMFAQISHYSLPPTNVSMGLVRAVVVVSPPFAHRNKVTTTGTGSCNRSCNRSCITYNQQSIETVAICDAIVALASESAPEHGAK